MYSFVLRSPLLRLVYVTPNSNMNWKSRYFFMEGDEWMCHPGDTEYMPVDMGHIATVWYVFVYIRFSFYLTCYPNRLLLQLGTVCKFLLSSGVSWKRFSVNPS